MKLVAVSDIHSHLSAVRKLKEHYSGKEPDLIIVCGDFSRFGPKEKAEQVLEELDFARVIAVPGNLDTPGVMELLEEKHASLHNKAIEFNGVNFVGFGGATGVIGDVNFSEEEISNALNELMDKEKKTVLVTHSPPKGTAIDQTNTGKHIGSKAVREAIEKFQPVLNLCGHCHEAFGEEKIRKSLCVNTGPLMYGMAAEIEIKEGISWKKIQLK